MRDAFEWELRARLRDLDHERADEARLHDLPETGDFPARVETCELHGMYAPASLLAYCPRCEDEWAEGWTGYRRENWGKT